MSQPPPVGPPPPWPGPTRPGTVTAAGVLTVVLAMGGALLTLVVGGLVVALGFLADALAESKGGEPQDQVSGYAIGAAVVLVAVGLLLSGLHLFLGVRVMRGGQVARVVLTLWDALAVIGGLGVLVLLVASAGQDESGAASSLSLVWLPLLALLPATAVLVCLWTPSSTAWFAAVGRAGPRPV